MLFGIVTAMCKNETSLEFYIVDKIKDIPEAEWDRLFGAGLIEGYGYHQTLQESHLKEFSFYYLLARRNNTLVAIIPFFTTDFSFTTIIQGSLQKFITAIQNKFSRFLKMKILFVGNPTCEEFYLGIAQGEDLNMILEGALKELSRFCKREKIGTLLFYNLTAAYTLMARYLAKKGFSIMASFPNTMLEIKSDSLESYINSLSKSTRKGLRRKLRDSAQAVELKTEVRDDISDVQGRIYELYRNNLIDGEIYFEILTPEFFRDICHNTKGTTKFFLTYAKDKIVAFSLVLIKGEHMIEKFVGFDAEVSHRYNLYYTTFVHNIDYCIKNGLRFYQMGITDYEPKVRLGSRLIPLYVYVRFLSPLRNLFSGLLVKILEPKRFDPTLKNIKYY